MAMTLTKDTFGKTPAGKRIDRFTLSSSRGVSATIMNWGATLMSVVVPDRNGTPAPITIAFATPEEYEKKHIYAGPTVGRFANRIARGTFALDGKTYRLACNDGANHLHGGLVGFDRALWKAEAFEEPGRAGVPLAYTSRDGEEGYPGTLRVAVTFALTEENELTLQYDASCDAATPVNLTNHAYWNLAGDGSGTVEPQVLQMTCPRYLPMFDDSIPTGEVKSVVGTPLDFLSPKPIGRDLGQVTPGYDHCFIREETGRALDLLATVTDPASGRRMEVWSTMPAVHFYTGNYLGGTLSSAGKPYPKHGGFCLETEFYPDCVNRPEFPSCILRPGQQYHHVTRHVFSTAL
jgi:aldose 1-epimerase